MEENEERRWADGLYQNESVQQKEAFEYYYSLGADRMVEKVAEMTGKTVRTIYEWSRRFNWRERINQYDIEVGRQLKEKTISAVVDEKANYRKIVKLAMADFVKRLRNNEIKVTNVYEFRELVRLDLTLMGESSEISETRNTNTNGLSEEDRKMVMDLVGGLKSQLEDDETA